MRCRLLFALLLTRVAAPPPPCKNEHADADCSQWASAGECDNNPGFMKRSCAKACDSCGWENNYCTHPPEKAAKPNAGDIARTFERAITFSQYEPKVHSSPSDEDKPGPWVITFENFISEEEAEAFVATTDHHFKRSLAGDVVSPVRTSQQAWCQPGIAQECVNSPHVQRVHERVVNVTGVPKTHAEFFQVLRYEPGQFYKVHHDQNTDADSVSGVRLFTFFIYLHTPDAGGETHFPRLGIKIPPKRGSALMWPNVMDHNLRQSDMRTEHEALPPTEGLKFSSNLWLHQFDFRTPNQQGCKMNHRVRAPRPSEVAPADEKEL